MNIEFHFDNNHNFTEIKNTNIDKLDYEIAHDLASVECTEMNISAYLGVYNNQFELTFNIHNKNDFNDFDNITATVLDLEKIKTQKELENIMKRELIKFNKIIKMEE